MDTPFDALRFCSSASTLLDHWLFLRADKPVCPAKKDFDPMALRSALPDVFLAERHSNDIAVIRVAGSETKYVTHKDRTGANIFSICHPSHIETLKTLYSKVCTNVVAAVSETIDSNIYGRFTAKSLHLPLLASDNSVRYVIGVTKALSLDKASLSKWQNEPASATKLDVFYTDLFDGQAIKFPHAVSA